MFDPQSSLPADWTPYNLRLAVEAAGVALWSWNVDDDRLVAGIDYGLIFGSQLHVDNEGT